MAGVFVKQLGFLVLLPCLSYLPAARKIAVVLPDMSYVQWIGEQLEHKLETMTATPNKQFESEIKNICALFTTDVIASIAFGLQANSLKNPNGEFRTFTKAFFDFTSLKKAFDFFVIFFMPSLVSFFRIQMISNKFSVFLRKTISK